MTRAAVRVLTLMLSLAVAACDPGSRHTAPLPTDTLVRLSEDDAKTIDPQKLSDVSSSRVSIDMFEGLTRFNGAGKAEPGIAQRWTSSADGLIWTFYLKPGVRFSDGTPIDAQVFADGFARLYATATAAPTKELFDGIQHVTAKGPKVVEVQLRQPDPALPDLLAQRAMVALPMHRIRSLGDGWTAERPLVTSGAYRLREWQLNDHMLLEPNPHWHEGAPPVPHVRWLPVPDKLTALRRFETGQADTTADFPPTRVDQLRRELGASVHVMPLLASYYYVFNTRHPPFNDPRIRQALSMTIDREWIANRLIRTGTTPAWGLVPPGIASPTLRPKWADWPMAKRQALARQLLMQAGYDHDRPLRFTLRFNSDRDHRRVATAIAAMWAPLGVQLSLFNTEAGLHFAAMRRGDFEMARAGWVADMPTPENLLGVHRSTAKGLNYSGYDSPAFDAALSRAQGTADPAARAQLMRVAEEQLLADSPIMPIYFYAGRSLVAPRVRGWQDNALNIHPSRTLSIAAGDLTSS